MFPVFFFIPVNNLCITRLISCIILLSFLEFLCKPFHD